MQFKFQNYNSVQLLEFGMLANQSFLSYYTYSASLLFLHNILDFVFLLVLLRKQPHSNEMLDGAILHNVNFPFTLFSVHILKDDNVLTGNVFAI